MTVYHITDTAYLQWAEGYESFGYISARSKRQAIRRFVNLKAPLTLGRRLGLSTWRIHVDTNRLTSRPSEMRLRVDRAKAKRIDPEPTLGKDFPQV